MSDHFLSALVEGETHEFAPKIWYNKPGDCFQFVLSDEAVVSNRVDDILTIYESAEDRRPIGFKIKSVGSLIKKFGIDALAVGYEADQNEVRSISLFALLLAAYEEGPQTIGRRSNYASVMSLQMNPSIPTDDLVFA